MRMRGDVYRGLGPNLAPRYRDLLGESQFLDMARRGIVCAYVYGVT